MPKSENLHINMKVKLDLDELPADTFREDMREYRRWIWKYATVFWLFMPYVLFAPAWNAVYENPHPEGRWVGVALLAAVILPLWVAIGWVGFKFRRAFNDLDDQRDEIYAARKAHRALLIEQERQLESRKLGELKRIEEMRQERTKTMAEEIDALRKRLKGHDHE